MAYPYRIVRHRNAFPANDGFVATGRRRFSGAPLHEQDTAAGCAWRGAGQPNSCFLVAADACGVHTSRPELLLRHAPPDAVRRRLHATGMVEPSDDVTAGMPAGCAVRIERAAGAAALTQVSTLSGRPPFASEWKRARVESGGFF
ncbi:hypothetical protein ACE103_35845 [Bradyrhizobium sp. ma5]|uniref:hypothetical protein n=1 Tax=Bradyrhizobium sp. ma5 TaxID=3344828 RepID=UPI0035D40A5A